MGCRMRCLDNFSIGKQENVDKYMYTFMKGDISDLDTCMKACETVRRKEVCVRLKLLGIWRPSGIAEGGETGGKSAVSVCAHEARLRGVWQAVLSAVCSGYIRDAISQCVWSQAGSGWDRISTTSCAGAWQECRALFCSERGGNITHLNADISKVKRLLGMIRSTALKMASIWR